MTNVFFVVVRWGLSPLSTKYAMCDLFCGRNKETEEYIVLQGCIYVKKGQQLMLDQQMKQAKSDGSPFILLPDARSLIGPLIYVNNRARIRHHLDRPNAHTSFGVRD